MCGGSHSVYVTLVVLFSWPMVHAQVPSKLLPTPPVPSKSLPVVQHEAPRLGRGPPRASIPWFFAQKMQASPRSRLRGRPCHYGIGSPKGRSCGLPSRRPELAGDTGLAVGPRLSGRDVRTDHGDLQFEGD